MKKNIKRLSYIILIIISINTTYAINCPERQEPNSYDVICICQDGYRTWDTPEQGKQCLTEEEYENKWNWISEIPKINLDDTMSIEDSQKECSPGYMIYTPSVGCEPIYCGETAYYDLTTDKCYCYNEYRINDEGNCQLPQKETTKQTNNPINIEDINTDSLNKDLTKQLETALNNYKNAQTQKEKTIYLQQISKIMEKGKQNSTKTQNNTLQRIQDPTLDKETKTQLKNKDKYIRLRRIQEKNNIDKPTIPLDIAKEITNKALSKSSINNATINEIMGQIKLNNSNINSYSTINDMIRAYQSGTEAQKETARILNEQKDKIDQNTKKAKKFLNGLNKALKFADDLELKGDELEKVKKIKENIEKNLGSINKLSSSLGDGADKLETLEKILNGDFETMAKTAQEKLEKYDGVYKSLKDKWLGRVNVLNKVNKHFEKIKGGDIEGMIEDFDEVINSDSVPDSIKLKAKKLKLFSQKAQQAKQLGIELKADEILKYYKEVQEIKTTLRGGAGTTAASVLGFTRLIDNLAELIKIEPLKDAIKMVNNAPKKMIEFSVKYQKYQINRLDYAQVGQDISKTSAISVFLDKNTNVVRKFNEQTKQLEHKSYEFEYTISSNRYVPKKKITYDDAQVKFVKKKNDENNFIYPVNVDADYQIVGDIVFKIEDASWYNIFGCNKMGIYNATPPHNRISDGGCI